jgi:hypothetical protein
LQTASRSVWRETQGRFRYIRSSVLEILEEGEDDEAANGTQLILNRSSENILSLETVVEFGLTGNTW